MTNSIRKRIEAIEKSALLNRSIKLKDQIITRAYSRLSDEDLETLLILCQSVEQGHGDRELTDQERAAIQRHRENIELECKIARIPSF